MSYSDMNRDINVCGDAYNTVNNMDSVSLGIVACSNRDEKKAQCARHLLVTKSNEDPGALKQVNEKGISYNDTTGKYTTDKCVSGGRRKRRTKKSKNGGKSKKSGGRRRRRTQRRNR